MSESRAVSRSVELRRAAASAGERVIKRMHITKETKRRRRREREKEGGSESDTSVNKNE